MRIPLEKAQNLLQNGQVVAIPTETVYGLAASMKHPSAIAQIFALKERPSKNPLIVHLAHAKQILNYASSLPPSFDNLANHFWPGPLTMVLPSDTSLIPDQARAGLQTTAFRIPQHKLALALIDVVGPLVMPSANRSGRPSATHPEHVEADFGDDFPVLDGGICDHGLESTILSWVEERWKIVRLGALPPEIFNPILGYTPEIVVNFKTTPICPGQLYRHYAPQAKLNLKYDLSAQPGVILGFNERFYPQATQVYRLGSLERPEDVAESLYAILRQLDTDNVAEASVDINFPEQGLWKTITERLFKASKK